MCIRDRLDGVERKYVEEVGSMNCFFKIDGVIRTCLLYTSKPEAFGHDDSHIIRATYSGILTCVRCV